MQSFFKKYKLIAVVAAIAANLLLAEGLKLLLGGLNISFATSNAGFFVREFVMKVIPAMAVAFIIGTVDSLKAPFKNLGKGLLSGGWMLFVAIGGSAVLLSSVIKEGGKLKSATDFVFYILFLLMVGLSEELLMRGTVTRLLADRFGREGAGKWITVLTGSVIFGIYHFQNYFGGQSLRATLIQVMATTMIGMLLCAVYVKWGNLYAVIILHAALDFMAISEDALVEGASIANTHSGDGGDIKMSLISNGTFVLAALAVMLHKRKQKGVENENND